MSSPSPLPPNRKASWLRNALFILVCILGIGAILGALWESSSLSEAQTVLVKAPDVSEAVSQINTAFQADWVRENLTPTEPADDFAIARRLSLALAGTIPSLEELRALEAQPEEARLDWWLAYLFNDQRFGDYVAERLARIYVGAEGGPFIVFRRRRMVSWLSEQVHNNVPYDELVRSLVASEGIWTSNPAANFITYTIDQNDADKKKGPDEVKLAARVTRAFLGVRIDCVQCHDAKMGEDWDQADFHQLAAFFSQVENSATGVRDNKKISYNFQYRSEKETETVPAIVPFKPDLLPKDGNLRERLAVWITHPENRAFARTTVNRTWALMFGKALVEPIDSIPLEGPWHPAMEALVDDFTSHGFDLQRLIRTIASTQLYQLESRSADPNTPVSSKQEQYWAAFPLSRLRPEQVAQSVIQASSLKTISSDAHIIRKLQRFGETNDFVKRYGDLGEEEFAADQGGTIPQRLLMMNGKMVGERTKNNIIMNAATRIGSLAESDSKAVETAYLAILNRIPTTEEMTHFVKALNGKKSKQRSNAMEDLYWALLNSTEFSWNH